MSGGCTTCNDFMRNVWTTTHDSWNAMVDNVSYVGYDVLLAVQKAAKDMDIISTVCKLAQTVSNVASSIFELIGSVDCVPAPLKAFAKATEGFNSVLSGKKWIDDLMSIMTGDAANKNPLWKGPNFLAIASKAAAFISDSIGAVKWLAKSGIINPISETIGTIGVFGKEIAVGLKDITDISSLTAFSLEFADNVRLAQEKGLSVERGIDVVSSGCKITAVVSGRVLPGIVGSIVSGVVGGAAGILFLAKWIYKAEWRK